MNWHKAIYTWSFPPSCIMGLFLYFADMLMFVSSSPCLHGKLHHNLKYSKDSEFETIIVAEIFKGNSLCSWIWIWCWDEWKHLFLVPLKSAWGHCWSCLSLFKGILAETDTPIRLNKCSYSHYPSLYIFHLLGYCGIGYSSCIADLHRKLLS